MFCKFSKWTSDLVWNTEFESHSVLPEGARNDWEPEIPEKQLDLKSWTFKKKKKNTAFQWLSTCLSKPNFPSFSTNICRLKMFPRYVFIIRLNSSMSLPFWMIMCIHIILCLPAHWARVWPGCLSALPLVPGRAVPAPVPSHLQSLLNPFILFLFPVPTIPRVAEISPLIPAGTKT